MTPNPSLDNSQASFEPKQRFSIDERLQGVKRLARACRQGDLAALEIYVAHGYDVDWVDENGENALMAAADHGKTECVEFLLSKTKQIDAISKQDMSAAMIAASRGHSDCLELILRAGCDPAGAAEEGWTALMWAAMNNARCVKILLAAGCPVDSVCREGRSAAMYAAKAGKLESLSALVEAGADVERVDARGVSFVDTCKPNSGCGPYLEVQIERVTLARHVGSADLHAKAKPARI